MCVNDSYRIFVTPSATASNIAHQSPKTPKRRLVHRARACMCSTSRCARAGEGHSRHFRSWHSWHSLQFRQLMEDLICLDFHVILRLGTTSLPNAFGHEQLDPSKRSHGTRTSACCQERSPVFFQSDGASSSLTLAAGFGACTAA
jgi:hypothetical protein